MTEVRSFLILAGYYCHFVENFFEITMLLPRITRKEVKFEWDEKCDEAFIELRKRLTITHVLTVPNNGEPYVVLTLGWARLCTDAVG